MQQNVTFIPRMLGAIALASVVACGGGAKSTAPDNNPATVTANGTTPASVVILSPINPAPSVIVKNARGTPLPNVRVIFTVTGGGGSVTGASKLTDASGIATVDDWTVGNTAGVQTLTATAGGKTATFTVTATNTCNITGALPMGATVTGNLTTSPCAAGDGTAAQSWSFQQGAGQTAVSFVTHSTGSPTFDTTLLLHRVAYTAFDRVLGFNDDNPYGGVPSTDSRLDVILGTGNYVISAGNFDAGVTGPFTLAAQTWDGSFVGCADAYITTGVTTNQTLTNSCWYNAATTQYIDVVGLYLAAGQHVQIDMSSTVFDPKLDMYFTGSSPILSNDNGGGGTTARLDYTATVAGIYVIVPTSATLAQTGAYTLSVTNISGGPVAPAMVSRRNDFVGPWSSALVQSSVRGFARSAAVPRSVKTARSH